MYSVTRVSLDVWAVQSNASNSIVVTGPKKIMMKRCEVLNKGK